jgi:hypothetical protein
VALAGLVAATLPYALQSHLHVQHWRLCYLYAAAGTAVPLPKHHHAVMHAGGAKFAIGEAVPQLDAVICCTGYNYSFPFLHLKVRN